MIEVRHKRLEKIFRAVEWWVSGDSSEDGYDEAWQKFLDGQKGNLQNE